MAIKISDIPPEGLTIELAESLDLSGVLTAYTAKLSIMPIGGAAFRITGMVKSAPVLECSRCLRSFNFSVDTDFDFELAPSSSMSSKPEHELERAELDIEFYEGEEIDPVDIIQEQILLSLPMVPIHSEECKGLCIVCGTDLNITDCGCNRDFTGEMSPFSVLKNILKK